MGVLSLVLVGIGAAMIVVGVVIALRDRRTQPVEESLSDNLGALQELLKALESYPLGLQIVVLGIVVVLVGGTLGGVAAL